MSESFPSRLQHVLRSRHPAELDASERDELERSITVERVHPPGSLVVPGGLEVRHSSILLSGIASRQVADRDGERQVVSIHFTGDFIDLHAYPLRHLDHDIVAVDEVRVALIPHEALDHIQEHRPALARKLWLMTLLDAAMHRMWVFRLGRLSAISRVAHFFCETNARLLAAELSDGRGFALPMTQADLGAICGLTGIHVNRVLRELRERGLCTWRDGRVDILDLAALTELGEFEPDYMYLSDDVVRRLSLRTRSGG